MKKINLLLAGLILMSGLIACSDSSNNAESNNASSTDSNNLATNPVTPPGDNSGTTSTGTNTTRMPLSPQDSTFVMKAAMGGMMEVEAGNVAQQNGMHDRVKAFATMMINDHSKSNSELMALVQGRGMTVPTALPADMQKHMEEMRKMKGKAFDNHYMSMMVNDHQKTIAEFEKQANSGADAELKSWAQKTLPVLQMHRDSATAINQAVKK